MLHTICFLLFSMLIWSSAPQAQTVRALVQPFEGGELGRSVATIVHLQLAGTLRRSASNMRASNFGSGEIIWDGAAPFITSHDAAANLARRLDTTAQLVLWGSIHFVGQSVMATAYLTLPKYKDFREARPEEWALETSNGTLAVDLPQRFYAFEPVKLAKSFVEKYTTPDRIPVFSAPSAEKVVGYLGKEWRYNRHAGDYSEVETLGKIGWVHTGPFSQNKPEIVDFVAGLIRVFRRDWQGAIDLFASVVSGEGAPTTIKADALMLIVRSKIELRLEAQDEVYSLLKIAPGSEQAVRYAAMHGISVCLVKKCTVSEFGSINGLLLRTRSLFAQDDRWYTQARSIVSAAMETAVPR